MTWLRQREDRATLTGCSRAGRPASAADPGRPGVAECDAGAALALVAQRLCSSAPLGQDGYAQVLAVTATGDVDHVHRLASRGLRPVRTVFAVAYI
jgi:hypothetical protein